MNTMEWYINNSGILLRLKFDTIMVKISGKKANTYGYQSANRHHFFPSIALNQFFIRVRG